jgi:hypothetical protein
LRFVDVIAIDQPQEEPQALVAKSTTYHETTPSEPTKSPTAGSLDIFDFQ